MRFATLFTAFIAAASSALAVSVQPRDGSTIEMSPRNLHEFAPRQVVAGSVCATVGPVIVAFIEVVPRICLCTEAGVLTPESLARLTAQVTLVQGQNSIVLGLLGPLLRGIVTTLTGNVASTPATCNYPANSFPLCTNNAPGGCNFGCDNGFFRCNGACRPNGEVCPTSSRKRDQTSARICPENWIACPVQNGKHTAWECVNAQNDLESCGGCAAIGQGTDCTALPGVDDVSCVAGKCQASSCLRGYVANGTECSPLDALKPRRITLLQ